MEDDHELYTPKPSPLDRKNSRNFVIAWSLIYTVFLGFIIALFFFPLTASELRESTYPIGVFYLLFLIVVPLSLIYSIVFMWLRYINEQYGRIRSARNVSFYVLLFLYPVSVILELFVIG